jgi:hypothetical protein
MQLDLKMSGDKRAMKLMKYMQKLGSTVKGAEYRGRKRSGEHDQKGLNNAQVIEYLKDGGRDIDKFNSDEADKIVGEYALEIERRMQRITEGKNDITVAQVFADEAAAYRKAVKAALEMYQARIEAGKDADGNTKPVTKEYAKWRANTFGVPNDTSLLFKASGQLLSDVAPEPGNLSNIKIITG